MTDIAADILSRLMALQDLKYRDFMCKMIPTVEPGRIIGVRTPEMKKLVKTILKEPGIMEYLNTLPHYYYEENAVHASVIKNMKDYEQALAAVQAFLPHVDNWAVSDTLAPPVFKKHLPELLPHIRDWLASDHTYTVRFGVDMLMTFYLDEAFSSEYADMVAELRSDEYYVNMMIAWYFATALAKQWEAALPYIEERRLDKWTHNKAIQKAVESYRISDEQKIYLKTLRWK